MVDCNLFNVNDGSFEANFVETRLTAKFSTSKAKKLLLLPSNFRPSKYDVICHKDREAREHSGNKILKRAVIRDQLHAYENAASRYERSFVIRKVIKHIRNMARQENGAGFVRFDGPSQQWYEVDDKVSRDRVSQCFREAEKSFKTTDSSPDNHSYHPLAYLSLLVAPGKNVSNPAMDVTLTQTVDKLELLPANYCAPEVHPTGEELCEWFQLDHPAGKDL